VRSGKAWSWAGVALVACGGQSEKKRVAEVPKDEISAASGTRLEVRRFRHGDVTLPSAIYDTERGEECTFTVASDGVERCLPSSLDEAPRVSYLDAQCEHPVVDVPEPRCDRDARYAAGIGGADCRNPGGRTRAYEIGEQIPTPVEVYGRYGDACGPVESVGTRYHEVEEIDPRAFVAARREVVPRTETLGTEMLVTDDGLRFPVRVHDLQRDRPCSFLQVDEDTFSERHCLGNVANLGARAAKDAQCSEPLANFNSFACGAPELVYGEQEDICAPEPLFEIGETISEVWVENLDNQCVEYEGGLAFYEIGAPTRADGYPTVAIEPFASSRLAPFGLLSAGTTLLQQSFWDPSFEAPCSPARTRNGKIYCVPENVFRMELAPERFADAACSVTLLTLPKVPCWSAFSPRLFSKHPTDGCSGIDLDSFYDAVRFEGDVVFTDDSGECTLEPLDPTANYYSLGDEVNPEDVFVELALE
jgi:hypothetical protein